MKRFVNAMGAALLLCATVLAVGAASQAAQTLTTLYTFGRSVQDLDGARPLAGLVQAVDGSFYGGTWLGGLGGGTIFRITPSGVLTTFRRLLLPKRVRGRPIPGGGAVANRQWRRLRHNRRQ
jgi:uncharacterized repeat protein (TIGR03803 family)